MIGAITTLARVTNRPERNANPQINSTDLTRTIKYPDASIPSLKIFKLPVSSGFGYMWKKNAIDPQIKSNPISVRTTMPAIFISKSSTATI